jgi:hypothetical protein
MRVNKLEYFNGFIRQTITKQEVHEKWEGLQVLVNKILLCGILLLKVSLVKDREVLDWCIYLNFSLSENTKGGFLSL